MRLRYDMRGADDAREFRHPQIVMKRVADRHGFSILKEEPVSIADCWIFTIDKDAGNLPPFIHVIEGE
jgi:hypothetical protein